MLLNASQQEFEHLRDSKKTVQVCPGTADKFADHIGKCAQIKSPDGNNILMDVLAVRHYDTIQDYLTAENWQLVAPQCISLQDALNHYHKFRSDEEIADCGGICAVELSLTA